MSRENISAWVTGCVCAAISAVGAFYRAEKVPVCPPVTQEPPAQDLAPTLSAKIRPEDEPLVRFKGTDDGQVELDNAAMW